MKNPMKDLYRMWVRLIEDFYLTEKWDPSKHGDLVPELDMTRPLAQPSMRMKRCSVKVPKRWGKDLYLAPVRDGDRLAFLLFEERRSYGGSFLSTLFVLRHDSFSLGFRTPREAWLISQAVPFIRYGWDASRMRIAAQGYRPEHGPGWPDTYSFDGIPYVSNWVFGHPVAWWTVKRNEDGMPIILPVRKENPHHYARQVSSFQDDAKDRERRFDLRRRKRLGLTKKRRRQSKGVKVADELVSIDTAATALAALLNAEQPAKSTPRKEVLTNGNNLVTTRD